jgi:hypothetical protein
MIKKTNVNSIIWEKLFQLWMVFWPNALSRFYDSVFHPPLFISEDILRTSKYFNHFPQQLYPLQDRPKLSSQFITPATCLHVYPTLKNKQVKRFAALGTAHCARYENGKWELPYRLQDFHMTELVVVGGEKLVNNERKEVKKIVEKIFADLRLNGVFNKATDAFFLEQSKGAKVIQQLKGLKQEFIVKDGKTIIALASINNHEDFFGKCFNIKSGKVFASSFCVAFGIERLTTFSLKAWGKNPQNWPNFFKKYAKILQ